MPPRPRMFRNPESLETEKVSRNLIRPFLEGRGFVVTEDRRTTSGNAQSQLVEALNPSGGKIKMRVRLCWRWGRGNDNFSACQLRARLSDDDWDNALLDVVARDGSRGITHFLIVQPDGSKIAYAALVPLQELPAIWQAQRKEFDALIADRSLGRTRTNPAMNGDSPTLWLMDVRWPRAHESADILWTWPGVVDVVRLREISASDIGESDDSVDDISIDYTAIGSDGASRLKVIRSHVKRDQAVRRAVLRRASEGCERVTCEDTRRYVGFLDVHHILGAETSDRYWNCVALCPNCHREAHFSPLREQLNSELLTFALQFKPPGTKV